MTLAHIRNSLHSNGVHDNSDFEIVIDGYKFEKKGTSEDIIGQSLIPHKSHQAIKLVRSIQQNHRTYYFDIEGNNYSMKQDGTLIPVIQGRIVRIL